MRGRNRHKETCRCHVCEPRRTPCKVVGCDRPIASHEMCAIHWGRFQRRGTTEKRARTLNAYTDANGYVVEYVDGKHRRQFQQRLVMERVLGRPLAADETVHHRNGVRSDNRPENLELWVSSHPNGSRVSDLLAFARGVIARYGEE